jgi:hypothetical protein
MTRLVLLPSLAAAVLLVPAARSDDVVDWQALHRPLTLPTLSNARSCPVSLPAPEITGDKYGVAGAIGTGPVYPMLGAASLVVGYRAAEWGRGPWAGQKVEAGS